MNTDALRTLRCDAGLSITELAERAGLHNAHVGRIERGERTPGSDTLRQLADALAAQLGRDVAAVLEELTAPVAA